jgi:hypothetical protein
MRTLSKSASIRGIISLLMHNLIMLIAIIAIKDDIKKA